MENTDREFVHFSESDCVIVKGFYVRRLMNRVNSLPAGHEYNPWSESLHIAHDVSHMRQIFAPTMAFEHATVLRGTLEPLKVRYPQTAGVLFVWRKKDTTKLYIQSHPFDDLSKLVEPNWSCVLFWNSDGRALSAPVTTPVTPDIAGAPPAPPPGLDPDEYMTPTGPDMPGDIPGDPFTPGTLRLATIQIHRTARQCVSTISRTTTTITVSTCYCSSTKSCFVSTFDSHSTRHSCCSNSCRSSYYS